MSLSPSSSPQPLNDDMATSAAPVFMPSASSSAPPSSPPSRASSSSSSSSSSSHSPVPLSKPPLLTVADYHQYASLYLPKSAYDYFRSGATDEQSLRQSEEAFKRVRLRPRFLRDLSRIHMAVRLLGGAVSLPSPIAIAPTAFQRLASPLGEVDTARAAERTATLMTVSSLTTTSMEDIRTAAPGALLFYQLYVYRDRDVTRMLVERAERAGYLALVVTVDSPLLGSRERDHRNNFSLPPHLSLANFTDPSFAVGLLKNNGAGGSGLNAYIASLYDRSLVWEDLLWLRSITSLPILVKGIMTGEDGRRAAEMGADAIIVSSHGARQLDGVAAPIEVLEEVVEAVNSVPRETYLSKRRIKKKGGRGGAVGNGEEEWEIRNDAPPEVYMDGGIRRGSDVYKALALGAKCVFLGRPVLWGLAYAGSEGVEQVIALMRKELELCMALAGSVSVEHIDKSMVTSSFKLMAKI